MFCPKCEAEYRPGFTECAHCNVPLVEALEQLTVGEVEDTLAVGRARSSPELGHLVEVHGHQYDFMRLFTLAEAKEVAELLKGEGIASLLVPIEEEALAVVRTGPVDAETLKDIVLQRHGATGLRFSLDGETREVSVEPRTTLLEALRLDLQVTGPKVVCDRGSCSA